MISMNCSGLLLLKYKKETFFNDLPLFAPAAKLNPAMVKNKEGIGFDQHSIFLVSRYAIHLQHLSQL